MVNRKIPDQQLQVMVHFMENDLNLARGKFKTRGPQSSRDRERRWEALAKLLNNIPNAPKKPAARWRELWNEKKYSLKRKVARINSASQLEGVTVPTLSEVEKRILDLVGNGKEDESDYVPFDSSASPVPEVTITCSPSLLPDESSSSIEEKIEEESLPNTVYRPSSATRRKRIDRNFRIPEWVKQLEERRLAIDEKNSATLERIADQITQIKDLLNNAVNKNFII